MKVKTGTGALTYRMEHPLMRRKPVRNEFSGAGRIIHHILWQYRSVRHQEGAYGEKQRARS